MLRKFTFLFSLVLINVMILGFTPQQEAESFVILWWFWLCFVSILIVGLFIWFMLVAGRREVDPIEPPAPPMAGDKKTADIPAEVKSAAHPVDTTEATMSETTYKVTDPDGKYVKGSLFGADGEASPEVAADPDITASATETVVEEAETVAAVETAEPVVETVVEETVVESVETPAAEIAEADVTASAVAEPEPEVVAAAPAPEKKKAPAKKKKRGKYGDGRDDLKKVEGIGPKIEGLFNADGIMTFEQLANAKIERLQGILTEAGSRYRSHNPGTWPEQAALAAKGDWDTLNKLQDELNGGVRK